MLIEGGATVAASALKAKIVDKLILFYAPKILGGDGRPMIDALDIRRVKDSIFVKRLTVGKSGDDLMLSAYVN